MRVIDLTYKKSNNVSKSSISKKSITTTRQENADKLIEFLDFLGINNVEKRKVMSRAYGIISKNLK